MLKENNLLGEDLFSIQNLNQEIHMELFVRT